MKLPAPAGDNRSPLLYFCDESHIRTSEWMAIGGLAIAPSRASLIAKEMSQLKEARNVPLHSEVKWKKAKSKPDLCHDYIDLLFRLINDNHAHFHIRFSPFHEYDHRASGERKQTDTVSKAYYQLLLHRAGRFYGNHAKILIRPDGGDCTAYLPNVMNALNADVSRVYRLPHEAFTHIQAQDSKTEPMLQLLDVTLGALTAARNGDHLRDGISALKRDLVKHALSKFNVGIDHSHDANAKAFSIWNVKPLWRKGAVPAR